MEVELQTLGLGVAERRAPFTYLVHRDDLAVSSTGGAALDTESGPLTGLANASKRGAAKMCSKGLCQTNSGSRLALAKRCRGNTTDSSESE